MRLFGGEIDVQLRGLGRDAYAKPAFVRGAADADVVHPQLHRRVDDGRFAERRAVDPHFSRSLAAMLSVDAGGAREMRVASPGVTTTWRVSWIPRTLLSR